ncbi:hypothetical protein KAR91_55860 [Candidatus Pacearchaeota archaeon]|nr:hypothetical protein [Candidatus Pacearchaeota archaeon]
MKTNHANWLEKQMKTAIELWNDQSFFIIEELVPEAVYMARREKAIELCQPNALITLIETRVLADSPFYVNNWHKRGENQGKEFQFRGWRPPYYYLLKLVEDYEKGKLELKVLLELLKVHFKCSQHTFFNAWDYDVKGCTAARFRKKLIQWKKEGKLKHLTGIEKKVNWVHNDYRISERLDENGLFMF